MATKVYLSIHTDVIVRTDWTPFAASEGGVRRLGMAGCPSCGSVVARRMPFCTRDGTKLPESVLVLFDQVPKCQSDPLKKGSVDEPFAEKKAGKPVLKPLLFAALAVVCVAVGLLLGSGKRSKSVQEPEKTVENGFSSEDSVVSQIEDDTHENESVESVPASSNEEMTHYAAQESESVGHNASTPVFLSNFQIPDGFFVVNNSSEQDKYTEQELYSEELDMCITIREQMVEYIVPSESQSDVKEWLKRQYETECEEPDVTYHVFSKDNWYVVSGYEDDNIFYDKVIFSEERLFEVRFLYPTRNSNAGEAILLDFLDSWVINETATHSPSTDYPNADNSSISQVWASSELVEEQYHVVHAASRVIDKDLSQA